MKTVQPLVLFEDATPETYAEWGMKSGLEIHQQLKTTKKLFCRCPVLPYSDHVDADILRHMRPTLSELGEYDGTALMEFKTRKNIIYQLDNRSVCTYEMDDTPPFELNPEALDIALEIALLLDCNIVSELHIARKQYLDGSIPTGFQRTTIVGIEGKILVNGRDIHIIQLGLEEDACREIDDTGHQRIYRTDRLGIPLVETVTYPELRTPQEVAAAAQVIRYLTRATGRVRTGIGAARQDVNVSVTGGRRVEIKGVPKIRMIPRLVHNEALRQWSLLGIKQELKERGITEETFASVSREVTDQLRSTLFGPLRQALEEGLRVKAVVLRGFAGILNVPTQPETVFSKEIVDRVRVIACLDKFPNLIHSDAPGHNLLSSEWTRLKRSLDCRDKDTLVITWGAEADAQRATEEIIIRAREATVGIPDETRQALSDGTNGFERILPGPDRMYPDTDLPPQAITEEYIQKVRLRLPERPWEKERHYHEMGVDTASAERLSRCTLGGIFERMVNEIGVAPGAATKYLTVILPAVMRRRGVLAVPDAGKLLEIMHAVVEHKLDFAAAEILTAGMLSGRITDPHRAVAELPLTVINDVEAGRLIAAIIAEADLGRIPLEKRHAYVMGLVMAKLRGRIAGRRCAEIARRHLGQG
jgi:glutamyl-tRNA(Gln) amidotransferase subunit E